MWNFVGIQVYKYESVQVQYTKVRTDEVLEWKIVNWMLASRFSYFKVPKFDLIDIKNIKLCWYIDTQVWKYANIQVWKVSESIKV